MSTSYGSRLAITRPVGWKRMSACGFRMARTMRSVCSRRGRLKCECTAMPTTSSWASVSSSMSSVPSRSMLTSAPARTRMPSSLASRRSSARRLDLALILAQLGRDPGEAEAVVELLLGAARDPPRAAKEAVLVQLPALLHGELAEHDVVRLAPREVEERGAEALLGDDAHIDLEPVLQLHAALRVALAEDARHRRQLREGGDRRFGRARKGEEVGVADGLLAAADRARDLDARHARHTRERRRQLVD